MRAPTLPFERVVAWYHFTMALLLAVAGSAVPGRWWLAAASLAVACGAVLLGRALAGRPPSRAAVVRWIASMMVVPATFTSLGLFLPSIHAEPYEWVMIRQDRALFGADAWVLMAPLEHPLLTEVLQAVYATFYFLPALVGLQLALLRRWADLEEGVAIVTFGFYLSYLGYFLWPTMSPYHFLESFWPPLEGLLAAEAIHATLDRLEYIKQDCVPSGHVMLSLITLLLARRYRLGLFWIYLPIVALLCFSTVYLRYHYIVDVLYGAAMVPVALWLHRRFLTVPLTGARPCEA